MGKSMTILRVFLISALLMSVAAALPAAPTTTVPPTSTPSVTPRSLSNTDEPMQPSIDDIQRFSATFNQIKTFYVDDVTDKKLFENAMRGMLSGLDPHSTYLDESEYRDLQISTTGEYAGLGLEITLEDGYIKVISPLDDSPAAKANMQSGDVVIKINNKMVKGLTLREAVELLRGKAGEQVKLTVLRKSAKKNPLVVTLTREKIEIQTVKNYLYPDHYAYLRLNHFQGHTASDMEKQLKLMNVQAGGNIKGLVLDLRNNPGGLLDAAIQIADTFIDVPKGHSQPLIVFTKGRASGSEFNARATPGDLINGVPIVVLINQGSASASEIVAGALQDDKRAIVVGTRSFGKGSVQTILPLDEKHGIKITTARYYTPSGRSIQATGIEPDIILETLQLEQLKKLPDSDEDVSLRESDLQGHLENTISNKESAQSHKNATTKVDVKDKKALLAESLSKDYQVQQAFQLLKGVALYQQRGTASLMSADEKVKPLQVSEDNKNAAIKPINPAKAVTPAIIPEKKSKN